MEHTLISAGAGTALVRRKRGPLAGVLVVLSMVGALSVWTAQRLLADGTAPHAQTVQIDAPAESPARGPVIARHEVSVTRPQALQWQPVVQLEGSLAPRQSTSLAFSVGGTLHRLSARVGDEVRAGARLAQLETSHAATQFAVTGARVRAVTAQLTLAVDHAERSTSLVASGSMHAASAIDSQLHSSMVEAELEAARAQHAQAQVVLNEHTLRAPFSGTIVEAPEAAGAVISPGAPLFRLADLKTLKLNASVSPADAALLSVGAKVVIDVAGGAPVEGHITKLLDTLEAHTRRVPLEAAIESPGALRAGAFVRAQAQASLSVPALRIPASALRPGTSDEVFVVEAGQSAKLAVRRIVHEVEPSGALLVRAGLHADDVVVLHPKSEARAGDIALVADNSSHARDSR